MPVSGGARRGRRSPGRRSSSLQGRIHGVPRRALPDAGTCTKTRNNPQAQANIKPEPDLTLDPGPNSSKERKPNDKCYSTSQPQAMKPQATLVPRAIRARRRHRYNAEPKGNRRARSRRSRSQRCRYRVAPAGGVDRQDGDRRASKDGFTASPGGRCPMPALAPKPVTIPRLPPNIRSDPDPAQSQSASQTTRDTPTADRKPKPKPSQAKPSQPRRPASRRDLARRRQKRSQPITADVP